MFIIDSVNNPFAGLPELTNENGLYCGPSCPTQAWSTSVMIELISEIRGLVA
jgi:glycogen debranching enzyme